MYNDAVIANKVREAILLDNRISVQDIMVICQDRVVHLWGDVDTPEQAQIAESIALEVDGVARVENGLFVRPGRWPPVEPEILRWGGRRQ